MTSLKTLDVTKSYKGRKVVRDLSLSVGQGEVVGLLGPNGAGKTTTFYMIVGLTRPDSGSVFLGQQDITHLPMRLRSNNGISYLPEEASVCRELTVAVNIMALMALISATMHRFFGPELPRSSEMTRKLRGFILASISV